MRMNAIRVLLVLWAWSLLNDSVLALTSDETNTISAHDRVAGSCVLVFVKAQALSGESSSVERLVTGSGFAVEAGIVVTNYHVIESATAVKVVLPSGESADASVVGTAPGFDLAVLRVPFEPEELPPAPLGTGLELKMGQKVLAVSHPLGLEHSMSVGIISGLNRELPGLELGPSLIQFDAAINPGQSGGPLVDSEGRVIGVTTAKISGAEAIGFAIPVDLLVRILPDLKEMGHAFRPQIGIKGVSVDEDMAALFDLAARRGILVEEVVPGSVAEGAGFAGGHRRIALRGKEYTLGGDIIVSVNGAPIMGANDLGLRFLSARPGEQLTISVISGSGKRTRNLIVPAMKH